MTYRKIWKTYLNALLSLLVIGYPICALSYTLEDAMIMAHENNNKILAEYQNLEASKMAKPKAYSELLPTVKLNNTNYHTKYENPADKRASGDPYYRKYGASITQPLFNGGSTYAKIKMADATVDSSIERLKDISNSITVSAVQAYEGVLAAREIFNINLQNEEIFERYLEFTAIRFKAGVITRTDVLQAEVRLSNAKAQKENAYAEMRNTEANFEHIVGSPPLEAMDAVQIDNIVLPSSVDELIDIAKQNNPTLKTYQYGTKNAKYAVNVAAAQILPTVTANAEIARLSKTKPSLPTSNNNNTYTLQVSAPLFQGGSEYANIIEKQHLARKADFDEKEIENQLIESCISIWNKNKTSKSVVKARLDAITAAEKALEGVKEEVNVGTRTTIDLLNAQSELFNAKVSYRTAKADLIISVYQMLQVMGQIDSINPDYNS
ncbi:MAG: type secretion outer membrane protein [Candidatus Midichloriaceae bacterium]|jgi:outer membrane protein|nr:type secretion outer membrane protein [Candidatus Midichloriaceae bacterium]